MKSIMSVLVLLALLGCVYADEKPAWSVFGAVVDNRHAHVTNLDLQTAIRDLSTVAGVNETEMISTITTLVRSLPVLAKYLPTVVEYLPKVMHFAETWMNSTMKNSTHYIDGQTVAIGRSILGFGHVTLSTLLLHKSSKWNLINRLPSLVLNVLVPIGLGLTEWSIYYFYDRISANIPDFVWNHTPSFIVWIVSGGSQFVCLAVTILSGIFTFISLCLGYSSSSSWATEIKEKQDTKHKNEELTGMVKENKQSTAELTSFVKDLKDEFSGFMSFIRKPVETPAVKVINPVYPTVTENQKETETAEGETPEEVAARALRSNIAEAEKRERARARLHLSGSRPIPSAPARFL